MNHLLGWLVLVVLASRVVTGAGQQTVQTCFVGAPGDLERCLLDQGATDIVVEHDYAVEATLNDRSLPINRNVTLRGPANSSPDERPVLDLEFIDGAVQLCASCVFTLRDLVLANDRLGTGPAYDFFTGKPGSRLRSIDTYRLRVACTPGEQQLKAVLAQQRSSLFPNPTAAQDIVLRNVTYKGKLYAGSVWSNNISMDIPYKYDEGGSSAGSHMGGYALVRAGHRHC